jgi:serine/threonine protein kinase/Tol biopolymer transport system component
MVVSSGSWLSRRGSPPSVEETALPLATGTKLGPYGILGLLGRGGMGEVYRATDSRLGREVAVKVLPAHTAADAEHRARLEREARAIAALSHPHICTLHDIGRSGETDYIVMELVHGETLDARLAKGPLPLAELLQRGAEIAEALQVAHRAGVLHRDLKPSNVMLTRGGAKLMDFGLARSAARVVAAGDQTQAATGSVPITGEGRIVGTVQYMAPEQLEGRPADTRSDIWALGVTLYEMASARRPFEGASSASVIGAILRDEPTPLAERAPLTPPALDRLVRRCLAKDPEARWQSAGDLAHELRWIAGGNETELPDSAASPSGTRRKWPTLTRVLMAGLVIAGLGAVFAFALPWLRFDRESLVRTNILLPDIGARFFDRSWISLSPNGKTLALTLPDSTGRLRLYVRHLGQDALVPVTDLGARSAFWSPDSRQIAFVTDEDKLVRIGVGGGTAQTICKAPALGSGAWGRDHWVVFSSESGSLMRVRDYGGQPEPVTQLDSTRHETRHDYPQFLPDGKHFTYFTDQPLGPNSFRVRVGSTERIKGWDLMLAHHAPVCDGNGWLVFMRDRALLAQRVTRNGSRLIGQPILMAEVPDRAGDIAGPIVQAAGGNLVYRPLDTRPVQISWYSRQGVRIAHVAAEPFVVSPEVSPDGRRAVMRGIQGGETWLVGVDLATSDVQRLTSMESWSSWPTWSANGAEILYASGLPGITDTAEVRVMDPANPAENRRVVTASSFIMPECDAPDGRGLFVNQSIPGHGVDILVLDSRNGFSPRPVIATPADEVGTTLVDGGRRIVFASNATGRFELYLADLAAPQNPVRLTRDGCLVFGFMRHPVWAVGDELFYGSADGQTLRSLQLVHDGGTWRAGEDRPLFTLPPGLRGICPSPDGSRFLVLTRDRSDVDATLSLVQGWRSELKPR